MALFNDTSAPKEPTLTGNIIKWLFRLTLVAICALLFFIGSLHLLQDTGEPQQNGLASAFSQLTGLNVEIGTLNEFELFPYLKVDFENVTLKASDTGNIQGRIANFQFQGPGSLVFTRKNAFHKINVQDAAFFENGFAALQIKEGGISDEEGQVPQLQMQGRLGERALSANIPLDKTEGSSPTLYRLKDGIPFKLKVGDSDIDGAVLQDEERGLLAFLKGQFQNQNMKCVIGVLQTSWMKTEVSDAVGVTDTGALYRVGLSLTSAQGISLTLNAPLESLSETGYAQILSKQDCAQGLQE